MPINMRYQYTYLYVSDKGNRVILASKIVRMHDIYGNRNSSKVLQVEGYQQLVSLRIGFGKLENREACCPFSIMNRGVRLLPQEHILRLNRASLLLKKISIRFRL